MIHRNSRAIGCTIALAVAALLGGCAQSPSKTAAAPEPPKVLDAIDDVAAENGDRILVIRDYVDETKEGGTDVRRRYQYAFNYTRGFAQLRTFSLEGELLGVKDMPAQTLVATTEEKAFAFEQVRADPRWKGMYRPDSTFYGGFIFRPGDHPVCGPNARCIHVFASDTGGRNTTLHVIYDLMTGYSEPAPPHIDTSHKTVLNPSQEEQPK